MCCHDCRYDLRQLDSRTCPECGRAFDPDDPHSWRDEARGFEWRLPPRESEDESDGVAGFLVAGGAGAILFTLLVLGILFGLLFS